MYLPYSYIVNNLKMKTTTSAIVVFFLCASFAACTYKQITMNCTNNTVCPSKWAYAMYTNQFYQESCIPGDCINNTAFQIGVFPCENSYYGVKCYTGTCSFQSNVSLCGYNPFVKAADQCSGTLQFAKCVTCPTEKAKFCTPNSVCSYSVYPNADGTNSTYYGCLNTTTCPFDTVEGTYYDCNTSMVGQDCEKLSNNCCYNTSINGLGEGLHVGVCNDDLPLGQFGTLDFLNWDIRELTRFAFLGLVMVFTVLF